MRTYKEVNWGRTTRGIVGRGARERRGGVRDVEMSRERGREGVKGE